jgi:hypothetical protein
MNILNRVPHFSHLFICYEHIFLFVISIDSSHTKRILTLPTEKEQTETDTTPSPTNDPNGQKNGKMQSCGIAVITQHLVHIQLLRANNYR